MVSAIVGVQVLSDLPPSGSDPPAATGAACSSRRSYAKENPGFHSISVAARICCLRDDWYVRLVRADCSTVRWSTSPSCGGRACGE